MAEKNTFKNPLREVLAQQVEATAENSSRTDYFSGDEHNLMFAQDSHDLRMDGLLPGYDFKKN